MKKIFLHIGANKTGTTALQFACASAGDSLKRNGLLYPETGRGSRVAGGYSHFNLASALGFGPRRGPLQLVDHLKQEFRDEFEASGCNDALVSAEFFMLRRNIAPVAKFFESYDTTVVVYLRRHEQWLESLVAQALLSVDELPWDLTVSGYIAHQDRVKGQYIDYDELLHDWASYFGRENLLVRPYEDQQKSFNVVPDLLEAIGHGEVTSLFERSPNMNASLPSDALIFIRRVRKSLLPASVKRILVRAVENGARGVKGAPTVTPEIRRDLRRRFEPQYSAIARKYNGVESGQFFSENWSESNDDEEVVRPKSNILTYLLRGIAYPLSKPAFFARRSF